MNYTVKRHLVWFYRNKEDVERKDDELVQTKFEEESIQIIKILS